MEWTNILKRCLEDANAVPVVLQASDLGIVSHFAKTHGLLKSGERIESGSRRLGNLAHVKSTIDVAGHLVQTVIWPHALFGTKFIPLGFEHFGASPWIACNVLVTELQDPEEYYHTQVLRNTRRYLCRAQTSEIRALKAQHVVHAEGLGRGGGRRSRVVRRVGELLTQLKVVHNQPVAVVGNAQAVRGLAVGGGGKVGADPGGRRAPV